MELKITLQTQFYQILQKTLIPALETGKMPILLAEAPIRASKGAAVLGERPLPAMAQRKKPSGVFLHRWTKEGLEANRFIEMGCVLEGEADYLIGRDLSTFPIARDDKKNPGLQIVTLRRHTFFITPPGVIHSDGSYSHWERPDVGKARSTIFWMLVSPVGVLCHLCRTTGETHISSGNLFLRDSDLYPLTGMLIKEMRLHSSDSNRVVKSLLCALLLRVERNLEDEEFITLEQSVRPYEPPSSSDSLMQQVFDHVERHLHHHLSLAGIAASVFVSRAHLSRRFRAALGISVMEYVTRRRIEIACSLLQDPKGIYVSIQDISRVVGFASASYFTQVFTKRMKMSPAAFQKQQRALLQESFFNATEETEREEAEVLAS